MSNEPVGETRERDVLQVKWRTIKEQQGNNQREEIQHHWESVLPWL